MEEPISATVLPPIKSPAANLPAANLPAANLPAANLPAANVPAAADHRVADPVESEQNSRSATTIVELDGLRGLAILSVFLFHYVGREGKSLALQIIFGLTHSGWIGVDLFFVLSGFLITRILIATKGRPKYLQTFYARRSLRIFPIYFGFLAILFFVVPLLAHGNADLAMLSRRQGWLWSYAANIAVAMKGQYYFIVGSFWVLHFWTLAIEEQFYLVWPAIVLACSVRGLRRICWLVLIATPIARMICLGWFKMSADILYLTPLRSDAFAAGALVASIEMLGSFNGRRTESRNIVLTAMAILFALGIWKKTLTVNLFPWPVSSLLFSVLAAWFAGLIAFVVSSPSQSLMNQILRRPTLRLVGKYSYGLYVIHFPLVPLLNRYWGSSRIAAHHVPFALAGLIYLLISFALCFGIAVLSFELFEKHFLRLKRLFNNAPLAADACELKLSTTS